MDVVPAMIRQLTVRGELPIATNVANHRGASTFLFPKSNMYSNIMVFVMCVGQWLDQFVKICGYSNCWLDLCCYVNVYESMSICGNIIY